MAAIRTLANSDLDQTFLHGPRGPEYQRVGGNDPAWYLYDGLGSVLGTVSPNGTIISTRKYDVYGSVCSSTGPSGTAHKFVGALGHPSEDDTGLIYQRARYMDPVTGRFVSEDPDLDGTNWFVYGMNSPTVMVDRDGKRPWPVWKQNFFEAGLALAALAAVMVFFTQMAKDPLKFQVYVGATAGVAVALMAIGIAGMLNYTHDNLMAVVSGVLVAIDAIVAVAQAGKRLANYPGGAVATSAAFVYALTVLAFICADNVDLFERP